MKFNSPRALELGRILFNHYGNWDAVRAAGVVRDDGVIEIQVPLALSSGEPTPQSEPQASAGSLPPDEPILSAIRPDGGENSPSCTESGGTASPKSEGQKKSEGEP